MDEQKLEELLRISKENHRMLRSMRRNAFWGGIIKFAIYVVLLVGLPLYFYATYVGPMVDQMTSTMDSIRGTSTSAQTRFGNFQDLLRQYQSLFSQEQ